MRIYDGRPDRTKLSKRMEKDHFSEMVGVHVVEVLVGQENIFAACPYLVLCLAVTDEQKNVYAIYSLRRDGKIVGKFFHRIDGVFSKPSNFVRFATPEDFQHIVPPR